MSDKEPKNLRHGTWASNVRVLEPKSDAHDPRGRLKQAIQKAGGNAAVSKISGIPISTLNSYLAGTEMRLQAATRIAKACNVSPAWLAFGLGSDDQAEQTEPRPATAKSDINVKLMKASLSALELVELLQSRVLSTDERATAIIKYYEMFRQIEDQHGTSPFSDEDLAALIHHVITASST